MIAIALCAVLLTLVAWTNRRIREQRLLAQLARDEAVRARHLAQATLNPAKPGTTVQPKIANLWAALTVNDSTFKQGQTKELRIEFRLVNDGDKVIDPKIAESHMVINGKELTDIGSVFGKYAPLKALSPGESLRFDWLMGDYFKEPGTYEVSWKGVDFQSSKIVFRIMSEKAEKPK
jgi:hypothetical protein